MNTVFPTAIEVIKFTTLILDLQPSCKKKLDDLEQEVFIDPVLIDSRFKESITDRLIGVLGTDLGGELADLLHKQFKEYIELVATLDVSGLTREQIMAPCIECYFVKVAMSIVNHAALLTLIRADILSTESNMISRVVVLLDNLLGAFDGKLSKEDSDKVSSWRRGEHVPDTTSIVNITHNPIHRSWLLLVSGLERLKQSQSGKRLVHGLARSLATQHTEISFERAVSNMRSHLEHQIKPFEQHINIIQFGLRRTQKKPRGTREKFDKTLKLLENAHIKRLLPNSEYYLLHRRARFHVFSGNLAEANELYKKAVTAGAYMVGDELRGILAEAKEVAASLESPDKIAIKKYKWLELQFGFDVYSVEKDQHSNKFEGTVEDWEVQILRQNLKKTFPPQGMFQGYALPESHYRSGYLAIIGLPSKPDVKNPNKKIWIDFNRTKRTPQLVGYAQLGTYEQVKTLLEAGANVNAVSDVRETALIFALEKMNLQGDDAILGLVRENQQSEFFELVSSYPHMERTVNQRTAKKRITALSLAVKSGKLAVVKKVLAMGADPQQRADTDHQTPLNIVLKAISAVKSLDETVQANSKPDLSNAAIDSFRRGTAGAFGSSIDLNRDALMKMSDLMSHDSYFLTIHKNYRRHLSLEELRAIARELIYAGSDPNTEHETPFKGYTPLMMAAEKDEMELFNLMLDNGGDPFKIIQQPHTRVIMNSYQIRDAWRKRRECEKIYGL